jgi:wyosine [tRNA(Phe)-imidazoG37] synthetase (radical SAM superfamily)
LGRTTNKATQRKAWIPNEIIIDQLENRLHTKPDYITLSGSGEPTLFSKIGELICEIKEITNVPVAVLTNGSLLWLPEVRNSLMDADLVLPSLDAGCDQLFRYINKPHHEISFSRMLEGLVKFRDEYSGKYWLEVFLLSGVTSVEAQINMLAHCIKMICPDKVQINTVTRPAVNDFAIPVPASQLKVIASQLSEKAEIIVANHDVHEPSETSANLQDVLSLLKRRPCSVDDIALGLGLNRNAVIKCVEQLCSQKQVQIGHTDQGLFYKTLV